MKAAFRIEVGSAVGLGHLRRSTTLAYEFKERGLSVDIFVPNNGLSKDLKRELSKDFSIYEFKDRKDINMFKGYDYLITDSYRIDSNYLERLKRQVNCLISIDDSNRIAFPVDYFINSAIYAKGLDYRFAKNTKPLLGTKYFLLRRGLKRGRKRNSTKVKRIFLSLGASKSQKMQKMLFKIVEELKKNLSNKIEVSVVLGPYFKSRRQSSSKNIIFYKYPPFINNLMSSADIAISAGGQTLYELAFLEVPTIGICVEEDQERNLEAFSSGGYCLYVGWANSKKMISNLKHSLHILLTCNKLREHMSKRQLKLIDGFGPTRVANEILS